MGCVATLEFTQDGSRPRLLWRASCACGWHSAPAPDSTAALLAASGHDGRRVGLLERRIREPARHWRCGA